MNKQELLAFLDERGIEYERVDHNQVFTVDDMIEAEIPHPDAIAKNLFIRDDKKRNYYLITVLEEKRVDLKEFRKKYETRQLTFASEELLDAKMKLIRGSVTPFGLLNNDEGDVVFYLDSDFLKKGVIGIHPNYNDCTLFLNPEDVIMLVKEHGNEINIMDI